VWPYIHGELFSPPDWNYTLTFCDQLSWKSFDNDLIYIQVVIYSFMILALGLVVLVFCIQVGWIYKKYRFFQMNRKARKIHNAYRTNRRLRKWVNFVNYKPSYSCLLAGALGLALIYTQVYALGQAKTGVSKFIDTKFRAVFITGAVQWNNVVNETVGVVIHDFDEALWEAEQFVQNFINNTKQTIISAAEEVENWENEYIKEPIESVIGSYVCDILWEILECACPIFFLPDTITRLGHTIPIHFNMPELHTPRFLYMNYTNIDEGIDEANAEVTAFIDDYISTLQSEIPFFIYLLCFGVAVFLIGSLISLWLYLKDKGCTRPINVVGYKIHVFFRTSCCQTQRV